MSECKSCSEFDRLKARVKDLELYNSSPSVRLQESTGEVAHSNTPSLPATVVCSQDELKKMNTHKAVKMTMKAVPRVPSVAAFVGCLDISTIDGNLTEMFQEAGVNVIKCTNQNQNVNV